MNKSFIYFSFCNVPSSNEYKRTINTIYDYFKGKYDGWKRNSRI